MGRRCLAVPGDICDPLTSEEMKKAVRELGGLDILVNNAGINNRKKTLETTV